MIRLMTGHPAAEPFLPLSYRHLLRRKLEILPNQKFFAHNCATVFFYWDRPAKKTPRPQSGCRDLVFVTKN